MRFIFPFVWFLIVTVVVGLAAVPNLITMQNAQDKMLHITVFCVLVLFPVISLKSLRHSLMVAAFLFLVGVGIELLQELVPGRQSSMKDMLANVMGLCCGTVIGLLMRSQNFSGSR